MKRGRKAYEPPRARWEEVAGLSNGEGGGATERTPPLWEGGGSGCQPMTTTGDFHPGLTQREGKTLLWRDTIESPFFTEGGEKKNCQDKRDTLPKGG